ncbi:uncharacterized protein LOC129352676 [Poeciliopsis prolifica]|uniref:uncharacterized protein LOC129352676 n=1 Tax=Poeciliopsis prolifica TaxID=188132 RepID=UPI0024145927|nr:uncharacterized protein LOC129352676 [Poeciliopsis prolifica]
MRPSDCDALTFAKPIQLTVSPQGGSPVSPTLFLLSRLQPAGSSQEVGSQSGPNVCLAAGFRPNEGDMVLETTGGPVSVKTNPARLSATTKTYYYPGFSNDTISSCKLGEAKSSSNKTDDQPDRIYPVKAQQNFFVLLISGVRLIFAKAVAFNTILTVRTLVV